MFSFEKFNFKTVKVLEENKFSFWNWLFGIIKIERNTYQKDMFSKTYARDKKNPKLTINGIEILLAIQQHRLCLEFFAQSASGNFDLKPVY